MIKNRDETMILIIIPTPLIYGEGLRHDCNPSEALLRLYSHPGTAIHIALEHTLHIAGIPTETLKTSTAILTVGSAV